MPRLIPVAGQKGGVGKTTTAMSLAAVTARSSRVLLVDVDPQQSATWWAERAEDNLPFDFTSDTDPSNLARLRELPYDVIFIDTPGSLEGRDVLAAVLDAADFAILPTEPSPLSIAPLMRTISDVVQAQRRRVSRPAQQGRPTCAPGRHRRRGPPRRLRRQAVQHRRSQLQGSRHVAPRGQGGHPVLGLSYRRKSDRRLPARRT